MKNSDMPANPLFNDNGMARTFTDDNGYSEIATGLTKREAFAMAAMQGLLSSESQASYEEFSIRSIGMADALLKELEK